MASYGSATSDLKTLSNQFAGDKIWPLECQDLVQFEFSQNKEDGPLWGPQQVCMVQCIDTFDLVFSMTSSQVKHFEKNLPDKTLTGTEHVIAIGKTPVYCIVPCVTKQMHSGFVKPKPCGVCTAVAKDMSSKKELGSKKSEFIVQVVGYPKKNIGNSDVYLVCRSMFILKQQAAKHKYYHSERCKQFKQKYIEGKQLIPSSHAVAVMPAAAAAADDTDRMIDVNAGASLSSTSSAAAAAAVSASTSAVKLAAGGRFAVPSHLYPSVKDYVQRQVLYFVSTKDTYQMEFGISSKMLQEHFGNALSSKSLSESLCFLCQMGYLYLANDDETNPCYRTTF
jgi:hypothetical protein